jgi:predicted oxidoreductase
VIGPEDAIDVPPYFAFRLIVAPAKSFGGVVTDTSGHVLSASRRPVPGLYAAGELTGMAGSTLGGTKGFPGSLSAVVYSGRIAGRNAAWEALRSSAPAVR